MKKLSSGNKCGLCFSLSCDPLLQPLTERYLKINALSSPGLVHNRIVRNIENEIKDYAKQHDLNIKGLKITLNDLKETGWSYTNKETALIEAEEKNKYFQEKGSKQRIKIIE